MSASKCTCSMKRDLSMESWENTEEWFSTFSSPAPDINHNSELPPQTSCFTDSPSLSSSPLDIAREASAWEQRRCMIPELVWSSLDTLLDLNEAKLRQSPFIVSMLHPSSYRGKAKVELWESAGRAFRLCLRFSLAIFSFILFSQTFSSLEH